MLTDISGRKAAEWNWRRADRPGGAHPHATASWSAATPTAHGSGRARDGRAALAESVRELRQLSSHLETIKEEAQAHRQGIHDELGRTYGAQDRVEMLHARPASPSAAQRKWATCSTPST